MKLLQQYLSLGILLALSCQVSANVTLSGSGTADDPYLINSVEELVWVGSQINSDAEYASKHYKLTADLDFAGQADWTPIGTKAIPFSGSFLGDGKVVRNVQIGTEEAPTSTQFAGFFGAIENATIQDLNVEWGGIHASYNPYATRAEVFSAAAIQPATRVNQKAIPTAKVTARAISASNNFTYAGGIVSYSKDGNISNCQASGHISVISTGSDAYSGGIVGYNDGCNISACHSDGEIKSSASTYYSYSGGIVGRSEDGAIANCSSLSDITAFGSGYYSYSYAGGRVGNCYYGNVVNCSSAGDVNATAAEAYSGGMIGYDWYVDITNSYVTGNVSSNTDYAYSQAGGMVGENIDGNISNCYVAGNVHSTSTKFEAYAGGIVAYNWSPKVQNTFALGEEVHAMGLTASNAYAHRIGHNSTGTFKDNHANPNMSVKKGAHGGTLTDVSIWGVNHGTDLAGSPIDMLNEWVASNPSSNGVTHETWKVVDGKNNGNPVFESENDEPTGITTTEATKATVYGANGTIVIENATAPVSVFNLSGVLVKSVANASEINIESGYYIVRVGAESHKVVVE